MTDHSSSEKTIEKDFTYKERVVYYEATVTVDYSYTPQFGYDPQEETFDSTVNITLVQETDYATGEIVTVEPIDLEKDLEEAIIEDASDTTYHQHIENSII